MIRTEISARIRAVAPAYLGAVGWVIFAVMLPGCGGNSASHSGSQGKGEVLPALDSPLPPLDDGRIELAGPKGWYYPPRSARYVFRVQKSQNAGVPVIALTAEDVNEPATLTSETANAYIRQLAERQKRDPKSYRVLQLGGRSWIAYRSRGRQPGRVGEVFDILALETVAAGRRYTLRLVCEAGTLGQWEPYLRAVASGIRFLKTEELLASKEGAAAPAPEMAEPAKGEETIAAESPKAAPAPASTSAQEQAASKPAKPAPKPEKPKPAEPELDLESLEELLR
ncbi:MAG: hypothetical protein NZ899_07735 [Thermoguttaceae bacterium]|nr:hypothetical protein [Thermoguttaceae bacterium]MDW8079032.1 hypothetical protein [Thermoguttaceae bacterium]